MESSGKASHQSNLKSRIEMLESIINKSEAGVYVSDYHTGEILFANEKTAEFIGGNVSAQELIGKICWEALNKDRNKRCDFCAYKKLIGENGELMPPYSWERYFKEYGAWAKITNQAISWIDGRIAQITTFHDISEMKKMQGLLAEHIRDEEQYKMQQNLQILLDRLPVAIGITDVETKNIVYANGMFREMFEFPENEDLIGQNVLAFLPQISKNGVCMEQRVAEILDLKGINAFEMEFITSSGKYLETRLTTCVLEYNNRTSSVGIVTDLASEKKQQRLLMQAAEREREANRLKSNFLSNMSHEIRTPMNAIIGLTEVELRKNTSEKTQAIYKKINNSAKNLLQIINDILDLSKIEANKIELFPVEFELEDVLNSSMLIASSRLAQKQVELILDLSLDLPRFLVGDKTRLWQILRNILDNAAKFTEKGNILLTISEDTKQSTADKLYITFSIEDTGVGMNEDQISRVFSPYEQIIDKWNMQQGGSGLGLPISKQLCELMGGDMEVTSRKGYGTTMMFTLPFGRSQNNQAEWQGQKPYLSGLSVLIADDNEIATKAIKSLLQSCGANCLTASGGEEALQIVLESEGKTPFDIVILDYYMKGMNSDQYVKTMRCHLPSTAKMLILTAYESMLEKDDLALCGISDIVEKPIVPTQFMQKLTELLDKMPEPNDKQADEFAVYSDINVLVCEDIELNQEVIASMLEQFGVAVIMADNGKEGFELLENGIEVDLVFMDLHMPVMDGYETTKAIRSNHSYDSLPIISLTADAMVETLNDCLAIGFNDVITKPVSFDDLQRMLSKWVPENKRK